MLEQERRIRVRIGDPRKTWKLSPMDLESYHHWYDYSKARDNMFAATDTGFAPRFIVPGDDKIRASLHGISHLLSQIPYKKYSDQKVALGKRNLKRMSYRMKWKRWALVGALLLSMVGTGRTEDEQQSAKNKKKPVKEVVELAKDVQNPVSDLLRFGFVNTNWFGAGSNNYDFNIFDLQAIWAKKLGNWAVINRLNIPLIYLPSSAPPVPSGDSGSTFGLGDIQYTAFLARDESKRLFKSIGGIGPTILFNSSTDDRIGTGKWGIGPSAAVISRPGRWLTGILVTNLWSFAGDSDRQDLNFFFLRPFVNYNLEKGWYLTTTPIITANWEATERNKWSVPIGGGVGKVALRAGKQPLNFRLQAFYFLEKADLAPDWTLNFEFQILFPQYDIGPGSEADPKD